MTIKFSFDLFMLTIAIHFEITYENELLRITNYFTFCVKWGHGSVSKLTE